MAQNDSAFTGSLPQLYDRELGNIMFSPYAADMAQRLKNLTSGRLLETAAGTGIVTLALASSLPAMVEIVATDLNQPMLDYAASKQGLEHVRFQQADAQALPFPDGSFDVVVCQFGVMFFPDRIAGMRETRRVLKLGGRIPLQRLGQNRRQSDHGCHGPSFSQTLPGSPQLVSGTHALRVFRPGQDTGGSEGGRLSRRDDRHGEIDGQLGRTPCAGARILPRLADDGRDPGSRSRGLAGSNRCR